MLDNILDFCLDIACHMCRYLIAWLLVSWFLWMMASITTEDAMKKSSETESAWCKVKRIVFPPAEAFAIFWGYTIKVMLALLVVYTIDSVLEGAGINFLDIPFLIGAVC